MNVDTQLQSTLKELQRSTGLPLVLDEKQLLDPEWAVTQMRQVTNAYKEKYNAEFFLQNLLFGRVQTSDIEKYATRLHIDVKVRRCLFLVEVKTWERESILEVLKNLFSSRSKQYLFYVDHQNIAFMKTVREQETQKDMEQIARMIVDTLNMEVMTHVRVSYGVFFRELAKLPEYYQENRLALRIGDLFYSEQNTIFACHLGIGRLVYELPRTLCRAFLEEVFGKSDVECLDEETYITLNKFFDNNLNIAETSRKLHIHRNTLIYRLEQMERRTGLDVRTFQDAMTLKIAMMIKNCLDIEGRMDENE